MSSLILHLRKVARAPALRSLSILLIGFSLLFLRASNRLLHPYIWNEDGSNLVEYFTHGYATLFDPVNGYLLLIPKLITISSVTLSFFYYPAVSTVMCWAITLFVFYAIAESPIQLVGGVLLAIASMLIPSDPEVFGLPLYTFWWTSLLLFLVAFWNQDSKDWIRRSGFIFFAGLSCPVILVVLPLFWIRAFYLRRNAIEVRLSVWATVCGAIQLLVMLSAGSFGEKSGQIDLSEVMQIIPKFLGSYLIGNILPSMEWVFGSILLLLIAIALVRSCNLWVIWGLAYLLCASLFMTISRVDIAIIHPALAGPRYFFLFYVTLSWLLLQFVFEDDSRLVKGLCITALIFSVLNVIPVLDRKHDYLDWSVAINSCTKFDHYMLPVHANGNSAYAWTIPISGNECIKRISNSTVSGTLSGVKTFPYRIAGTNELDASQFGGVVVKNEWHGRDYYSIAKGSSTLQGWKVLGSFSFSEAEAEAGELVLHLHRGAQIWFRSEPESRKQKIVIEGHDTQYDQGLPPTSNWVLLEFSNKTLPSEFDVRFIDGGDGWGEWSALGLK